MFVRDSVLADATIEQLCVECSYFLSVDDIQLFGVRSEHKASVFIILLQGVSSLCSLTSCTCI